MLDKIEELRLVQWYVRVWSDFKKNHPEIAQFLVFFIISNGITVLQMIMMPMFKAIFNLTPLVGINFQLGQLGHNFDGSKYFMFDYAEGTLATGGGGGLAYFLAVQTTLAIASIINFFGQRNVTFKSKGNVFKDASWYVIAYIMITLASAALQGLYKAPIYSLLMNTWDMGNSGETIADFITMIITCGISFWVYYPILKFIFKNK